jgi:hypothetical protein
LPMQPSSTRDFTREYDLCVTGEVNELINSSQFTFLF